MFYKTDRGSINATASGPTYERMTSTNYFSILEVEYEFDKKKKMTLYLEKVQGVKQ